MIFLSSTNLKKIKEFFSNENFLNFFGSYFLFGICLKFQNKISKKKYSIFPQILCYLCFFQGLVFLQLRQKSIFAEHCNSLAYLCVLYDCNVSDCNRYLVYFLLSAITTNIPIYLTYVLIASSF